MSDMTAKYLIAGMDPWDAGYVLAKAGGEMPSTEELLASGEFTRRQVALYAFGFAEGAGYRVPPLFRAKAEWLYREPNETLDRMVIAIDMYAIGTDDDGTVIFASDSPPWCTGSKPH